MITDDLLERLGHRVSVQPRGYETPCWIWTRSLTPQGYGDGWFDGIHTSAHRWAYEQATGYLPPHPCQLDHLCSIPSCCNPDHLDPVLPTENARRSRNAKLTKDQIAAILAADESYRTLGKQFGVTHQTIYYYKSGQYEKRAKQWT